MPGGILVCLAFLWWDRRGGAAGHGVRAKFLLLVCGAKDGSTCFFSCFVELAVALVIRFVGAHLNHASPLTRLRLCL